MPHRYYPDTLFIFERVFTSKKNVLSSLGTLERIAKRFPEIKELKKIVRVLGRVDESAPHEVMLIVDAGNGQNALNQARQFNEAVNLSGITITKLDGTARGGVLFAIAEELGIPIRFIGVGESAKDLRPFDAGTFIHAILPVD